MIGYKDYVIAPQGAGQFELLISEYANDLGSDQANLYVSINTTKPRDQLVFDPVNNPTTDDFVPVDTGITYYGSGGYIGTLLASADFWVDLTTAGVTGPVSAIVIEGLNADGLSLGYDVMSVQFSQSALQYSGSEPGALPEPASLVLLGLGGLGLLFLRRRSKQR